MKNEIHDIFLDAGAELCGFAGIGLFADAPEGFHPADIYPECKTVIVFAKPVPRGTALVSPRIVYNRFNFLCSEELDRIALSAANELEKRYPGSIAVPVPSDSPYDYWDPEKAEGRGIISMKHAAMLAGLGTFGKSTLLLNSEFGNMLCFGAVLTNLELPSDEPAENICIKNCSKCADRCPVGAISENGVNQKLCREHVYTVNRRGFGITECNSCRIACPMVFGKH